MDRSILLYVRFDYKYYIVFFPKHRREAVYGEEKEAKIIEANAYDDNIYVGKDNSENKRIILHALSKRKKHVHNIQKIYKLEIQIWQKKFLM